MVCRKRSCYDTRNCFIDSLASRLHILQFVTWPISIFQADVDKNPSAPHTRLHFVMTWRMHRRRGTEKGSHLLPLLSPAVLLHGEGRWWKRLYPALSLLLTFGALGLHDVSPGIATMESASYSHLGSSSVWYYGPDPLPRRVR